MQNKVRKDILNMKKLMAYLMAIIMLLSIGANAFATNTDAVMQTETAEATEGAEGEEVPEIEPDPAVVKELGYSAARAIAYGVKPEDIIFYDNIVVANTTPMRGDFFTELWTNSTSDIDVRNLLHGYNLVRWDGENGAFRADPTVVTGMVGTENIQSGDRTYTMVLANDLYYSDGSRITAWDYAFSFLLRLSPAIQEIGGAASNGSAILGADDYSNGDSNVLAGVRVTADDVLAVTLNGDYLPFFFELGLLSCNPYPISVIAPGCEVRDDGNGVYIRGNCNAALLNSTVNGADGYRINPSVVSGPYKLTSFDGVTAEFERNDYYKGNADQEEHCKESSYFFHVVFMFLVLIFVVNRPWRGGGQYRWMDCRGHDGSAKRRACSSGCRRRGHHGPRAECRCRGLGARPRAPRGTWQSSPHTIRRRCR